MAVVHAHAARVTGPPRFGALEQLGFEDAQKLEERIVKIVEPP